MLKILIVEDDCDFQSVLSEFFLRKNQNNTKVDIVDSCAEALLKLAMSNKTYDLVIIDYQLRGNLNGLFLYKEIAKNYSHISVLMLSGLSVQEFILKTKKEKNVPKFLSKPFSLIEFEVILADFSSQKNSALKRAS